MMLSKGLYASWFSAAASRFHRAEDLRPPLSVIPLTSFFLHAPDFAVTVFALVYLPTPQLPDLRCEAQPLSLKAVGLEEKWKCMHSFGYLGIYVYASFRRNACTTKQFTDVYILPSAKVTNDSKTRTTRTSIGSSFRCYRLLSYTTYGYDSRCHFALSKPKPIKSSESQIIGSIFMRYYSTPNPQPCISAPSPAPYF
jgi:hypothetical protein